MELQGASNSASHVTESDHVTSTSDHVTTEIDRTECRTVLDLYRCLVQSCLDGHFTAVYRPSNSDKSDSGESVMSLNVLDKISATQLGSLKLFIIGARIVGHLRLDDGLLMTWSRDLAQCIRFDVPIGPRSFRDLQSEIHAFQTELLDKMVLHLKSQGGIINLPLLSRMPDNVIDKIFSFLPGSDLREMSFVCRRFKNIAYSDELWRGVCKKHSWFTRLQQKDRLNGAWRAYYRQYRKFRNRRHRLRRELLEVGARAAAAPIIMINRRRGRRRGDDPQQPIMVIDRRRQRRHGARGAAPNIRLNRGARRGFVNPPAAAAPANPPAPDNAAAAAAPAPQRVEPVRRVFARINPNRRLQIAVRRLGQGPPGPNRQQPARNPAQNPPQVIPNNQQPIENPLRPAPDPIDPTQNRQQPPQNPMRPVQIPQNAPQNSGEPVQNNQPPVESQQMPGNSEQAVRNRSAQQPVQNPSRPASVQPSSSGLVGNLYGIDVLGTNGNSRGSAAQPPNIPHDAVNRPASVQPSSSGLVGNLYGIDVHGTNGNSRGSAAQPPNIPHDAVNRPASVQPSSSGLVGNLYGIDVHGTNGNSRGSAAQPPNIQKDSGPVPGSSKDVSDRNVNRLRDVVRQLKREDSDGDFSAKLDEILKPLLEQQAQGGAGSSSAQTPNSAPASSSSTETDNRAGSAETTSSVATFSGYEETGTLRVNPAAATNTNAKNSTAHPNSDTAQNANGAPTNSAALGVGNAQNERTVQNAREVPQGEAPEVGQPIPVLAPFPDPPNEEAPDDQLQLHMDGADGGQYDNFRIVNNFGFRINLNAEPVENDLLEDPAQQVVRGVRVEDGNVHINAGGVNIAIEPPVRGDQAPPPPPPRVRVNNPRERVRLRGRLCHRNENSPFYQLDPRNIQVMRARLVIISSEFVKRVKCNLSGEFPPNHGFLTQELVHMSNLIAQKIRQALGVPSEAPNPGPVPPSLPQFYPDFDPEMPPQETLQGRITAIAEIFNEILRSSLRSDRLLVNRTSRGFQDNTKDNNVHPPCDNLVLASHYFHQKIRELISGSELVLENVVVSEGEQTCQHRLTHQVLSATLGRSFEEIGRRVVDSLERTSEQRQSIRVRVDVTQNCGGQEPDRVAGENRQHHNSAGDRSPGDDDEHPGPSRIASKTDPKRPLSSETEIKDSKAARLE